MVDAMASPPCHIDVIVGHGQASSACGNSDYRQFLRAHEKHYRILSLKRRREVAHMYVVAWKNSVSGRFLAQRT